MTPGQTVVIVCPGHARDGQEGQITASKGLPDVWVRVVFASGYVGFFVPSELATVVSGPVEASQ